MGNDVLMINITFGIRVSWFWLWLTRNRELMLSAYFDSSLGEALDPLVLLLVVIDGVDLRPELTETHEVSGFPLVARMTTPRPVWGFSFGRGSSLELVDLL